MRLARVTLAIVPLLMSCSTTPPRGQFIDQVITPLSVQLADERIDTRKAQILADKSSTESLGSIGGVAGFSVGGPPGAAIGGMIGSALASTHNADVDTQVAELEAQRIPFRKKVAAILIERVAPIDEGFSLCVEQKERRYQYQAGQFQRQPDGPACQPTH